MYIYVYIYVLICGPGQLGVIVDDFVLGRDPKSKMAATTAILDFSLVRPQQTHYVEPTLKQRTDQTLEQRLGYWLYCYNYTSSYFQDSELHDYKCIIIDLNQDLYMKYLNADDIIKVTSVADIAQNKVYRMVVLPTLTALCLLW